MRNVLQYVFAALVLSLGAFWAFIVLYAYVHALLSGATYLWHWMFN